MPESVSLEQLLLEHGLLQPQQLTELKARAAEQDQTLEQIIEAEHLVYPEPLAQLKAQVEGVPYIDLGNTALEPAAMTGVSKRAAATYRFLAFAIDDDDRLKVAMADPSDRQAQAAIRFIAAKKKLTAEIYGASPAGIATQLATPLTNHAESALREFNQAIKVAKDIPTEEVKLRGALAEAPINKVVAVIIRHAIDGHASDIHIEPGPKQLRVRYRIDGQLHTTLLLPVSSISAIASRLKILANMPVATNNLPQAGRFSLPVEQQTYSLRVNITPTISGEYLTIRMVHTTKGAPSLSELGMNSHQQALVHEQLQAQAGLIIVAGPDGAGKSTTLFSLLAEQNTPDISLATIEDPVEYELPGASQIQVQPNQGLTFSAALRSLSKQDIDVMLVSQLSDLSTARLTTQSAHAGRLVFASLNAPDAAASIAQLLGLGLNSYELATSLRLVISQRLVPRLCQDCKQAQAIPSEQRPQVQQLLKSIPKENIASYDLPTKRSFYVSPGCPACDEAGIRGQVALFEVVPTSSKLKELLAAYSKESELRQLFRDQGHVSLAQDGLLKALQGLISYEDATRATSQIL